MINDYRNPDAYSEYKVTNYPIRHKRKVPFAPQIKLSAVYRKAFMNILEMDRKLNEVILSAGDYLDLINDAYSSNIHWSVSTEGNPLTLREVRRISTSFFKDDNWDEKRDGPTQEILNHLYSYLRGDPYKLPWDKDTIRSIHRTITENTGIHGTPGEFRRTGAELIDEKDGFVYMIPCPEKSIEEETDSLLDWLRTSPYDAVVTAAVFFHEFESIHPFTDGNGRTGRTSFHILIQEFGLKNAKLCRFEEEILRPRNTYYDLLGYTDATSDYEPLLNYFVGSLEKAYENASKVFDAKNVLKNMDESSKAIAIRSKKEGWFTISDAARWIPSLGEQRVRHKLNGLVDMDVIEKEGKTRSTRFRFKDPLHFLKRKDDDR
ncbi:MAG: Fic family protein [Methanomassiliicoccaceae archaeon]|nr:Fic family protein [Methanomassiliicoccaceae archaeon]